MMEDDRSKPVNKVSAEWTKIDENEEKKDSSILSDDAFGDDSASE